MHRRCLTRYFLPVLLFSVGCGGDDPTGPYSGDGTTGTAAREIKAQPSFSTDINEILQRRGCSAGSCHGASGGQAGLMLTTNAGANYGMLVNVQATSENFLRVEAGNAGNSYMVIKLEGRQSTGGRMPLGGSPLDNIDLTNIKNWINNGAPQN